MSDRKGHVSGYGTRQKLRFVASYIGYKLLVAREVRSPKLKMSLYEVAYSLKNALASVLPPLQGALTWPFADEIIETKFGKFGIRRRTADAAVVSPAFERLDVEYLLKVVRRALGSHKRVLFVDIGADIGTYSITLLNEFADADLRVLAFEPVASSRELFEQNLRRNGVEPGRVRVEPFALGRVRGRQAMVVDREQYGNSRLSSAPDDAGVEVTTLDTYVEYIKEHDFIVMKLDIEGAECDALEGAGLVLASGKPIVLVVEDFVEPRIIDWLESRNFDLLVKLTGYNSWWCVRAA